VVVPSFANLFHEFLQKYSATNDWRADVIGQAVAKWPMKKFIAICKTPGAARRTNGTIH